MSIQELVRCVSIVAPKLLPADFCNNICQQRIHTPQQIVSLFDHLVGAGEERGWNREAERFGTPGRHSGAAILRG